MNIDKRDEYLIVVSTIVAILASKVADFILPHSSEFHLIDSRIDPWLGLLMIITTLICLTLFLILPAVKFLTHKAMEED